MRVLLIIYIVLGYGMNYSFSQNKKEQIEALNFSIDSLKNVLSNEKMTIQSKTKEIQELLKKDLLNQKEIAKLNKSLNDISELNEKFKLEIEKKDIQFLELKNLLFLEKIKGEYAMPFSFGTCVPEHFIIIDDSLNIKFKTICYRPKIEEQIEFVGHFELNKKFKFDCNISSGFQFTESGIFLLNEDLESFSTIDCCDENTATTDVDCKCFVKYNY
jgi:hypothetical protein